MARGLTVVSDNIQIANHPVRMPGLNQISIHRSGSCLSALHQVGMSIALWSLNLANPHFLQLTLHLFRLPLGGLLLFLDFFFLFANVFVLLTDFLFLPASFFFFLLRFFYLPSSFFLPHLLKVHQLLRGLLISSLFSLPHALAALLIFIIPSATIPLIISGIRIRVRRVV